MAAAVRPPCGQATRSYIYTNKCFLSIEKQCYDFMLNVFMVTVHRIRHYVRLGGGQSYLIGPTGSKPSVCRDN